MILNYFLYRRIFTRFLEEQSGGNKVLAFVWSEKAFLTPLYLNVNFAGKIFLTDIFFELEECDYVIYSLLAYRLSV